MRLIVRRIDTGELLRMTLEGYEAWRKHHPHVHHDVTRMRIV